MKIVGKILKVLAVLAAIAGVVFVVATYGDKIVAWAKKLLNKLTGNDDAYCDCECDECDCDCDGDCDDCYCQCDCETACPCDAPNAEEVGEAAPAATEEDFQG